MLLHGTMFFSELLGHLQSHTVRAGIENYKGRIRLRDMQQENFCAALLCDTAGNFNHS